MTSKIKLRNLRAFATIAVLLTFSLNQSCDTAVTSEDETNATPRLKNKVALNAYSFNKPLRDGDLDVFEMMTYASELGFDGVDLTGYYFPGYPDAPTDEYIYSIKKHGFDLGLDICGTGTRNNFSYADPELRKKDIEHIKTWILVAEKLGAPALRIFTGKDVPEGYTWDETAAWMAKDILECAEFGEKHGVVLEIQNHNNFLKTAEEVSKLMEMINSEWVGLMLDIGSLRTTDPYMEIEQLIKYAISWQLKENVFINQVETKTDLAKIRDIIAASDYKGYLPIETLGAGDPFEKVDIYFNDVIDILK